MSESREKEETHDVTKCSVACGVLVTGAPVVTGSLASVVCDKMVDEKMSTEYPSENSEHSILLCFIVANSPVVVDETKRMVSPYKGEGVDVARVVSKEKVPESYDKDTEARCKTGEHGVWSSENRDSAPIYRNVGRSVMAKHGIVSVFAHAVVENGYKTCAPLDEIRFSP